MSVDRYEHWQDWSGGKMVIEPSGDWVKWEDHQSELRKLADESASALDLVSRIRFALGDNGKRTQDELIAYCAEMRNIVARQAFRP